MKINRKLAEAQWVDYPEGEEVKFKIRPFPMSQGMWMPDDKTDIVDFMWKRFNYCVVDWQGVDDEEGNPFNCTEENKKFIFDYAQDIMGWISSQIIESSDNLIEKKT